MLFIRFAYLCNNNNFWAGIPLFSVFLSEFYLICHREGNEKYIQITGIYAYTVLGESSLCSFENIYKSQVIEYYSAYLLIVYTKC